MNRRRFLHTAAIGTAVSIAFPAIVRASNTRRAKPNLIVFLPDQQRADTLACYGAGRVHAPNLNKLASQSVVVDRTYITHPVCTPSRSSLLTGTWPHQNGCTHNNLALDPHHRCFPELLADSDYRTGYMGKWHLGDEVFAQHGFEEWVSIEDSYQKHFSVGRDPKAISDYSKFLLTEGLEPDQPGGSFSRRFASNQPIERAKPAFLECRACGFIERHRREPFVLFVSFLEPHPPYHGPLDHEHRLDEVELDETAAHTFGADMPLRYRLRQEFQERDLSTTLDDYHRVKQKYFGLVTQIDRSIGAILSRLEDLGLADDTIVVHTSDHGDMMGNHRLIQKEVMFDHAARVPYLVRLPGQRRQLRVTQPISHIDFVPTLLELLGRPPHPQCAGRSRAPLLRGEALPAESVFLEWSPNGSEEKARPDTQLATPSEVKRALSESTRAVVSPDGWKLCRRDTGEHELYNLLEDPLEMHNLYRRSGHTERIRRMSEEIYRWQQRTGDKVSVS